MRNTSSVTDFFGDVIHSYTREQAIADGMLVDVTEMAREAGFRWPVAITRAAWADCVEWFEEDSALQVPQDENGRLWDVLMVARHVISRQKEPTDRLEYGLYRVPRDGKTSRPVLTTLEVIAGPGDQGEPVFTILLPDED